VVRSYKPHGAPCAEFTSELCDGYRQPVAHALLAIPVRTSCPLHAGGLLATSLRLVNETWDLWKGHSY
jgi:hypothetical protein